MFLKLGFLLFLKFKFKILIPEKQKKNPIDNSRIDDLIQFYNNVRFF